MNEHHSNIDHKNTEGLDIQRCLYCGQVAELVWVHGHGQCSNCGINTQECCRGESCAFDQNQ